MGEDKKNNSITEDIWSSVKPLLSHTVASSVVLLTAAIFQYLVQLTSTKIVAQETLKFILDIFNIAILSIISMYFLLTILITIIRTFIRLKNDVKEDWKDKNG